MYQHFMESPIGRLRIVEHNGEIMEISRCNEEKEHVTADGKIIKMEETFKEAATYKTPILEKAEQQLNEYFSGKRKQFDLAVKMYGTHFYRTVWKSISSIPYGKTWSYSEIARSVGRPDASRAVGLACHYNPILIVIPCHRVVYSNGEPGESLAGTELRKQLLELEMKYAD